MASTNRSTLINNVVKVVKKHYKPLDSVQDRTVLEHLVVACCVENSLPDAAEGVFQSLSGDYFDWNEVRVSTLLELAEVMKSLTDPEQAATRVKRILQSVFETHYSFDLEAMRKQNIGQAVKQIEKYNGSTPFTVAYVTQRALEGHSIPVNRGLLESLRIVGVISDAEAAKYNVPGLERTVPKSKGVEVGSLLHQLGVEFFQKPYGPTIRKILLEINPDCKDRLPKRPSKKTKAKAAATESKQDEQETEAPTPSSEPAESKATKKPEPKPSAGKKKTINSTEAKKPVKKKVKKKIKKKVAKKKATPKKKKKKVVKKKVKKKKPK